MICTVLFKRRCITMVTYAVHHTWSGAGISLVYRVRSACAASQPLTMSSPFVGVPVGLGARIVQGSLRRQRVFRDRSDPSAFSENICYQIYRFSSAGIRYLIVLVGPYVGNATHRGHSLTVAQCVFHCNFYTLLNTSVVFPSFLPTQTHGRIL